MTTLEKQLKTSRDRLRMIADCVPALIAYVDSDQRYVFCNADYSNWFGLPVKEVIGVHVSDVFDEKTYKAMEPHIIKALAGEKQNYEIQLSHRRKGSRINNTILVPDVDDGGEVRGFCVLSTDITEIKRAEADTEEKNKELAVAMEKIERSNRELEQFASVCSHDLKEPLRMIKGYVELLQNRYADLFDEKAALYFHYISKGAKRMEELVQGLLDYACLEDPSSMARKVNLQDILDQALENLEPCISENNVSVTCSPLPLVKGYDIQLMQLFQNLIGNSLKFRRESEQARIQVAAVKSNYKWRISISDNGIGVPREHGERIFKIFQRLETDHDYPGTGIGLSICKKIVENHGGRIWNERNEEDGTTFHFTLPPPD